MKAVFSAAASVTASIMLARTIANDFIPHDFQEYFFSGVRSFFSRFSSQVTIVIEEFDGLVNNQIYEAVQIYLSTKISPSTRRIKVSKPEKENKFNVSMEPNEEVVDVFNGVKVKWFLASRRVESGYHVNHGRNSSSYQFEVQFYELSFHMKHQNMVSFPSIDHFVVRSMDYSKEKFSKSDNGSRRNFILEFNYPHLGYRVNLMKTSSCEKHVFISEAPAFLYLFSGI